LRQPTNGGEDDGDNDEEDGDEKGAIGSIPALD
jgi:hypothetical protein